MFLLAQDGYCYPISQIVRFGLPKDHVVLVELTGDRLIRVDDFRIDEMYRRPVTAFAAQPETYVVDEMPDEPGGFYKTAIVGWSVSIDGSIRPITPRGIGDDDIEYIAAVMTPDGKVCQGGLFDTIERWLEIKKSA